MIYNLSEEGREKLRKARLGKKASAETREKQRIAKLGKTRIFSPEHREKINKAMPRGEKHYNWLGDKVGISQLHIWINEHMPKPKDGLCQGCGKVPLYDAANVTGLYNRDFSNWLYLCKLCHYYIDNKMMWRDPKTGAFQSRRAV